MTSAFPGDSAFARVVSESGMRLRRMRPMLGTLCAMDCVGPADVVASALEGAFSRMRRVEQLMHPQRGVDLLRINQTTGHVLQVDELTWQVLQLAKRIHEISNGVFDPCLPTDEGSMNDVELVSDGKVICHAPVNMDLGGIAKGFAIDCAIDALKASGCSSAIVNAGGDVRAFGEVQTLHVTRNTVMSIELQNQALAVSESHNPDRPVEHRGYYRRDSIHGPVYKCVAVVAATAALADALTKWAMWTEPSAHPVWTASLQAKVLLAEK